ncbi:hypothetical protein ACEPAF_7337 [Sanghuangporus sanghuang]
MRVGKEKDQTPSRDSGNNFPSGSRSIDDPSVKRRQSLTSAVSAFASELRLHTKKPGPVVFSRIAGPSTSKSTDDLSLANAARSKSCTHLPAINTAGDGSLLTLVLSGTSFLDTTISESGERLYVIDTKGARTNISREDPVQGVAHVGAVNWLDDKVEDRPLIPRHRATIQMAHGRRYFVDEFLRRTKLTSSRLFNIPHYPHALKWKRSGGNFKLSAAKGKAAIADLDLVGTTPRIAVFDTLYEHDVTHPLREHRGVPVLLLDYLIATALLITCEKDKWLAAANGQSTSGSGVHGAIHRWRMEVQPDLLPPPERSDSAEEELESRSSSPDISSSSVLDNGPSSSGSHVEVSSDPGAGLSRQMTSPQSRLPGTRNSHLSTTSPQSSTFARLPPLSVSTATHPFSSEFNGLVDEDGASTVFSPLASVLPPTLGVSVGDASPLSPIASVFSDSTRRFESPELDSTISTSVSREYSHDRSQSIESPIGPVTPRQESKSLPSSPMGMSTRRPATAGAALGGSGGRRPFRPLPRPPVHSATLPAGGFEQAQPVPPAPSLPLGSRDGEAYGGFANARAFGSCVVSLSPATALRRETHESEGLVTVSSTSHANDGPRTIRRTASDMTLSAKAGTELDSQQERADDDRRESRQNSSSLLKDAVRRSVYKEPFPSSSPSPSPSPASPSLIPAPIRTLSESSVPMAAPATEPLRLRHPRPVPSNAGYDALFRAPSSSSSSYSHTMLRRTHHVSRPSEYAQPPPPDDGRGAKVGQRSFERDGDDDSERGGESECGAPPAYDTIDFSHPPLKTPGFRSVGKSMQNDNYSSSTSDNNHGAHGSEGVEDVQEAYKRALVELVAKVMNPPDFTKSTGISQRTSRYEWCININKLLRKFKSINSRLASPDVPASFLDIDAFVRDAWKFAFTDEVPGFYEKWPKDLDKQLEEGFMAGRSLGKMMIEQAAPTDGNEAIDRDKRRVQNQYGSAAGSAAVQHSRIRAASGASSSTSPKIDHGVTPTRPVDRTPSLDSCARTGTQSSGTPLPLTPKSSISPRRFTLEDFEQLVREGNKEANTPNMSRTRMQPRRVPSISSSPTVQRIQHLAITSTTPESCAPPPPSLTPVPELESSVSLRRSESERPWIPQSYRDGSMPADITRLYDELDKVCEEADVLILEAHDINAQDANETRLKEWTVRARRCEVDGRKILAIFDSSHHGISETPEILWVQSTLRLLKSAHFELIDFAEAMLNTPANAYGSGARASVRQKERIDATRNLQPAIRHSLEPTAAPESRATTVEATNSRPEVRRAVNKPGPSRPSARSRGRLVPYIEVPRISWKWRPAAPGQVTEPQPEPEPVATSTAAAEPKPNRSQILTSSITIRTRQLNPNPAPGSASSIQGSSGDFHTIKLQRMTDRAPGDEEHVPACSECAVRGFSCFGKRGGEGVCRRCKRVKRGRCTYARKPGRPASSAATTAATATTSLKMSKGKGKEVTRPKPTPRGRVAAKLISERRSVEIGTKRTRGGRSSGVLQKLRNARMRMEKGRQQQISNINDSDEEGENEDSASEDGSDGEYVSDADANIRMPPRKRRRRSASARATRESETGVAAESMLQASVNIRATSEPPDTHGFLLRSQSRRPTFASLASPRSSTIDWNMDNTGIEGVPSPEQGSSGGADVDIDSQSTLRSTEPDAGRAPSGARNRSSDVQMEKQSTSERETEALMEVERESPHRAGPEARLSVSTDIQHSASSLSQAIHASTAASIPTPTSLTGSSPTGAHIPLASLAFPVPTPAVVLSSAATAHDELILHSNPQPDPRPIQQQDLIASLASLKSKLDSLTASHARHASLIEEAREDIRLLTESASALTPSVVADDATRKSQSLPLLQN